METPQVLLEHHLKALRLPTFLREYDKVAQQCAAEGVDYPRYLLRLSEQELLDRERRATERRIQQARFRIVKSLDSFDFLAIPSLNKALVLELARSEFIDRKENVLALETRAQARRTSPWRWDWRPVRRATGCGFTTAAALVHELMEAKDEKRLLRFQKLLASYELLIIDELGMNWGLSRCRKRGRDAVRDLQSRYERGATLVTSNLPFHEWTEVLGSERLTGAPVGPAHPSRPHPGDERGKLPAEREQTKAVSEACQPITIPPLTLPTRRHDRAGVPSAPA